MTQGASNPVYHNSLANYGHGAYGNISYSSGHGGGLKFSDPGTMTLAPKTVMPTAYLALVNGDVEMSWFGFEDDGTAIMARFEPEDNITTREYMLVNQCMLIFASTSQGRAVTGLNPIAYIRKNHLERHFVFSAPKELQLQP